MRGSADIARKVAWVTWPSLLVMITMVLSGVISIVTLSALRNCVGSYATWAGAERDAAAYMLDYAQKPTPASRHSVESALPLLMAYHTVLVELNKPVPDYAAVRKALQAGGNPVTAARQMTWLIRIARLTGELAKPLHLCRQLDRRFVAYDALWTKIQARMANGSLSAQERAAWLTSIRQNHQKVVPLEKDLEQVLDQQGRALESWLLVMLAVTSAGLVVASFGVTYRIVSGMETVSSELKAAQESAALLLSSISDTVVSTGPRGEVQFLNAAGERLLGWTDAQANGKTFDQILSMEVTDGGSLDIYKSLMGLVSEGHSGRLSTKNVQVISHDGRRVPVNERVALIKGSDGTVTGAVIVMRDVTSERQLTDQLRHQALHDALTGLANRACFEQALGAVMDHSRKVGAPYATMFVDLDQFKIVNDSCGHYAGDEFIRKVAIAVREAVPEGNLVARLGGDEFGVVLRDSKPEDTLRVAESVRRSVDELRFVQGGRTFRVGASVGVVNDDQALSTVTEVLRAADRACYAAKEAGRNRVRVYRPTDQTIRIQRGHMQWVARLNEALEEERLELYAQEVRPLHAGSGKASSYELLLRLRDEKGRLILPGVFIPAAERFGLMPKVDRWVITQACAEQGRRFRAGDPPPVCMINLSRASVDDPDITTFIAARLLEHRIPRGHIGFELTETAAIGNLKAAVAVMQRLRDLGCPLALDDFGSGMSSYRYLRELPLDLLKIDGSFVRNVSKDQVAHAIIDAIRSVAQAAGLRTVAEAVEDLSTLRTIEQMNIDFAQGYAVGREQPWSAGRGVGATLGGGLARA